MAARAHPPSSGRSWTGRGSRGGESGPAKQPSRLQGPTPSVASVSAQSTRDSLPAPPQSAHSLRGTACRLRRVRLICVSIHPQSDRSCFTHSGACSSSRLTRPTRQRHLSAPHLPGPSCGPRRPLPPSASTHPQGASPWVSKHGPRSKPGTRVTTYRVLPTCLY